MFSSITFFISFKTFYPIYSANEIIITYGFHPFDICSKNPNLWNLIKITYIFTSIFSFFVFYSLVYTRFLENLISSIFIKSHKNTKLKVNDKTQINKSNLYLLIGYDKEKHQKIYIPEKSLFQNILITGTIGSGKTSSSMYPFTKQLMEYNCNNPTSKIGMLILDVKGNYSTQVSKFADELSLSKDLVIISLNSDVYYNPLHKPHLKPQILANRLKTILLLFSENNSESYWIDKAEEILTECIKFCRLYNNGYVTFVELHKLITIPNYYQKKLEILKNMFINSKFNTSQIHDLNSSLDFFEKEFSTLDARTKAILISEITRITNVFVSDYDVVKTFCSPIEKLSFHGFDDIISKGKIVVLNMNISEYSILSRIIATYLKLDFQSEVISNLSKNISKTSAFICDEYDKFASKTDSEFFSMSREAKCINIVSTQSYSSLKTTLKDDAFVKVTIQNLINKIWYRTDDVYTIEEVQKQIGKEEKSRVSKSISENAKETRFSYFTNSFNSENSNISESYSTYTQNDFIYESNFFSQNLETFTALTFLSDGDKILRPTKLNMLPYFKNTKL